MNKREFGAIVKAYQAAMKRMVEANLLDASRGTIGALKELGLDIALHLPVFISDLVNLGKARVPTSVTGVCKLGNAYDVAGSPSPHVVLTDAGLLLAALSRRLPEEKNEAVARLVDDARAQLRKDDIHLMIEGVSLLAVPKQYIDLP